MHKPDTSPFATIESTQEFFHLLEQAISDTLADVQGDLNIAQDEDAERRVQALRLVTYRLDKLAFHAARSRRLLNDLVMLRRLLFEERITVVKQKVAATD